MLSHPVTLLGLVGSSEVAVIAIFTFSAAYIGELKLFS